MCLRRFKLEKTVYGMVLEFLPGAIADGHRLLGFGDTWTVDTGNIEALDIPQ